MTEPNETILRKVRALMDKANRTEAEFPGEAKSLRDKAMEMMAAYGIEQAMLAATGQTKPDEIIKVKIDFLNPYSREKHTLLHCVAKVFSCRAIGTTHKKSVLYAQLIGHTSDVERVEFLYTLLLVQAENGASKINADDYNGYYTPREVAAWSRRLRAGYMAGFADEVYDRLQAIQRHAEQRSDAEHAGSGTPGTALVLASRRDVVDRRYEELFPDSKKMSSRSYSATGLDAGRAGGRRADLGQNRFTGGRKALAG